MWVNKIKLRNFIEKVIDSYPEKVTFTIKTTNGKNYTCSYNLGGWDLETIKVFDKKKGKIIPLTFKSPYEFAYFLNMSWWQLEEHKRQQKELLLKFSRGENYTEITIIK